MKREKERRKVLLDVTEDWFRDRGTTAYVRKWIVPYIAVIVVILGIALGFHGNDIVGYMLCGVMSVVFIIALYFIWRSGKRFWNEWRDKPEPIELPPLPQPKFWWKGK